MSSIRLLAVGDISLQTRNNQLPFANITGALGEKDILFGNLETALTGREAAVEKSVALTGHPGRIAHMKEAGFDIVNVANNHIMDAGIDGFNQTLDTLAEQNLPFVGGINPAHPKADVILEHDSIRLGFLGYYTYGTTYCDGEVIINSVDEDTIVADMNRISNECDHIIVSLHWGIEKAFYPSPDQITLAHSLIDNGASVILGHHPHVVQAVEEYGGGVIAYSLGNFQFFFDPLECGPTLDRKTNRAIFLSVCLSKEKIESHEVVPVGIDDDFRPYFCDSAEREKMLAFVDAISGPVKDGSMSRLAWYGEIAPGYLEENFNSFQRRLKKYGGIHYFQFFKWLISPFMLMCYAGWIRRKLMGSNAPR